jgi:hypothetical protein
MPPRPSARFSAFWIVAGLVVLALLVAFCLPGDAVICGQNTDMIGEFVAWRAYMADSLYHGHLPLWNPYTYGGQPFLTGFESAVLYPPNLIFLVLPLGPALNFSILFHHILLGSGMYAWARSRGLDPRAAALAGVIVPLSGAVFPHVYAGHLSNLCTMAWAPWIFLGLETASLKGHARGWLLAAAGVALQIFAGHVQYVFYTAIAAGLQALVLSIAGPKTMPRWRPWAGVVIVYTAAVLLAAGELFPAYAASSESIRQQKLDYAFAAMFGFPPENLLTLIAPGFFGSLPQPTYWGRCYLWEMSLFVGTASLVLAALAWATQVRRRQAFLDLAIALPLLILALGVHTPAFDLLYAYAPGFGHFRSWSKFIFPVTLFLALIVASGADALFRGEKPARPVAWATVLGGGVAALIGVVLWSSPMEIEPALESVLVSHESYLPPPAFNDAGFIASAGVHAGLSLLLGGLVLLVAGGILLAPVPPVVRRWGLPALVAVEMVGFAAGLVTVSHFSDAAPTELKKFVADHPGDYRVLNELNDNNGFLLGAGDLWGNNPTVLRRYAEFMTFIEGQDPDHATQYVSFRDFPPALALVRFKYGFIPTEKGLELAQAPTPPLPHVLLVSGWETPGGRDEILAALNQSTFDGTKTVLLEQHPNPIPVDGAVGTAKIVSEQPDELVIEADTDKPTLLLVTDLYAQAWKAEALPGSAQSSYEVLPADYILRAVPLQAGHHRLRMFYAPGALPVGLGVSAVAWLVWIVFLWRLSRRK